jgi:hypothetical protein
LIVNGLDHIDLNFPRINWDHELHSNTICPGSKFLFHNPLAMIALTFSLYTLEDSSIWTFLYSPTYSWSKLRNQNALCAQNALCSSSTGKWHDFHLPHQALMTNLFVMPTRPSFLRFLWILDWTHRLDQVISNIKESICVYMYNKFTRISFCAKLLNMTKLFRYLWNYPLLPGNGAILM